MNINNFRHNHTSYGDYAYFVYGLIRQYNPNRVVEIGLGPFGHTAFAVLQALSEGDKQDSKYTVMDLAPTEEAKKMLALFPEDKWELIVGDSGDASLFEKIKGEADIFLVDGNHSTKYCFNDTVYLLMNNRFNVANGLIVYHDTNMMSVRKAIENLKKELNLDVFYMNTISTAIAKIKS